MTTPRLNLLVIRSPRPNGQLLQVARPQFSGGAVRQKGPVHWAAEVDGAVMEIYPARSPDEVDDATRLGFEVDEVETILDSLRDQGVEVVSDLKQTQWGLPTVVKDPDGRSVELVGRGEGLSFD